MFYFALTERRFVAQPTKPRRWPAAPALPWRFPLPELPSKMLVPSKAYALGVELMVKVLRRVLRSAEGFTHQSEAGLECSQGVAAPRD